MDEYVGHTVVIFRSLTFFLLATGIGAILLCMLVKRSVNTARMRRIDEKTKTVRKWEVNRDRCHLVKRSVNTARMRRIDQETKTVRKWEGLAFFPLATGIGTILLCMLVKRSVNTARMLRIDQEIKTVRKWEGNYRYSMALSKREYEDFKNAVDKIVYKYVTRERSTIVSLITHTVDSGSDKRKLEDKLATYVDKSIAFKLADKSFAALDGLGVKPKISKKRSHRDEDEKETKRARLKEDEGEVKIKSESQQASGPLQAQQIKDLMAKAQATIEERKRALALQGQTLPSLSNGTGMSSLDDFAGGMPTFDVSSRIAQLQARIHAQLGGPPTPIPVIQQPLPGYFPALVPPGMLPAFKAMAPSASAPRMASPEHSKPTPLILDSEGRTIDLSGKEVHLTLRCPTLKANIRAKKREEFKQQLLEKPVEESSESHFYDTRVPVKPFVKTKRTFKFHEQGKYIQLAQRERAKSRLEKLQQQISQVAKKTGISSAAKLAQLEQRDQSTSSNATPNVEWWDAIILEKDRYPVEGEPVKLKEDYITNLVEHPMEMKCSVDLTKLVELQVFLTKKERKKLRRMNRRETWKEKQEKIRLGLEPPPEPKVRMANLMRVLGTEAVLDPTKMEKHVREQMAKRLKAHEDANAARKLTPEQKRDKKIKKIKEDTTTGVHVTIYRVTDMSNGSHKFKIETNAKQLYLTGTVVLFKDVNVVVVEGGPKQQKKYKRLMMERIKWAEESRSKDASIESKCQLVWEGMAQDRSFGEVLFKACPSEMFAREHFKKHGVEHYWDLAFGKKVLEEAEGL